MDVVVKVDAWMAVRVLALLVIPFTHVDAFLGVFGDSTTCKSRYFTQTGILPPLSTSSVGATIASMNGTDCESFSFGSDLPRWKFGGSVPVTYTNNPRIVDDWLCRNLPYTGSIIGFDIEGFIRARLKIRCETEAEPEQRRLLINQTRNHTCRGNYHIPKFYLSSWGTAFDDHHFVVKKARIPHCHRFRYVDGTSFVHGATVQLATPHSCLVVQLVRRNGRHSHGCAPILKSILADENYVKAGCAIDGDLIELHDLWGDLDARSRFDLGIVFPSDVGDRNGEDILITRSDNPRTIHRKSGLKSLSRSILGIDLPKDCACSQSDWSAVPLSENQIVYAARDAWAGAAIANRLAEFDPQMFGREALVGLCRRTETPIPLLADRRRRRNEAKQDLQALLLPYCGDAANQRLPRPVQKRAMRLRQVINRKVIDHHYVFETGRVRGM